MAGGGAASAQPQDKDGRELGGSYDGASWARSSKQLAAMIGENRQLVTDETG